MAQTVIRVPINNVKGGGDYTGEIRVGSQGTVANVILDTGSSTLAVGPRVYKSLTPRTLLSPSTPSWLRTARAGGAARFSRRPSAWAPGAIRRREDLHRHCG